MLKKYIKEWQKKTKIKLITKEDFDSNKPDDVCIVISIESIVLDSYTNKYRVKVMFQAYNMDQSPNNLQSICALRDNIFKIGPPSKIECKTGDLSFSFYGTFFSSKIEEADE